MSISESLNNSNSIKAKQELITKEIIISNYDKNYFFKYCLDMHPEKGDDINNWSLEELQQVINSFKTEIELKTEKDSNSNEIQKKLDQNIKQQEKISDQNTAKNIFTEINCKVLEKTELNDKDIKVVIKNPTPVETVIYMSNYILYEVNTVELNWNVKRRYSDFLWLRQMLCKFYPRNFIPPMPKKQIGSRRFEEDFVEKRMKYLQIFMNRIMDSETLKTSEALYSFLYIKDRNQFEYKMKELNSSIPSQYISEIKTLTGKLSLSSDTDENEKYYVNINNYFNLQTQIFERLNDSLSDFYSYMSLAAKQLEEVDKDFDMLSILNSKVQMKQEITRSYEELHIFFKNWKRMLFNQNEMIQNHIQTFFNYVNMEGRSYQELLNSRDEIKKKYQNEKEKLKTKKDKLWASMDINKWEITEDMNKIDGVLLFRDRDYAYSKMCSKDTNEVLNLKQYLNYANKALVDELKELVGNYSFSFVKNIQEFTNDLYPNLNDGLSIWSGLSSFATIL